MTSAVRERGLLGDRPRPPMTNHWFRTQEPDSVCSEDGCTLTYAEFRQRFDRPGFSAFCEQGHDRIDFDDPAAFEAHMTGEHKAKYPTPTKVSSISGKRWKAPGRREYRPKPDDPGQPITWTEVIEGGWVDDPELSSGGFRRHVTIERTGVIWSRAAWPNALFVIADDEPGRVCQVGKDRFDKDKWVSQRYADDHAIRRAENVRRNGIFAVVDQTRMEYTFGGKRTEVTDYTVHTDRGCPDAYGPDDILKPEYEPGPAVGGSKLTVDRMVRILTHRETLSVQPSNWCRRCVWLVEETGSAA